MGNLSFPPEVEDVFYHFYTCEFSTITRDGTPVTWPVLPIYLADPIQFVILSPAGLSQKADRLRRHPRVSLLFSEPAGSGLSRPPAVEVQGEAVVHPGLAMTAADYAEPLYSALQAQARKLLREQPAVGLYMRNPVTRYLMDWYFMRRVMTVTPRRILWWEQGDFTEVFQEGEALYVG